MSERRTVPNTTGPDEVIATAILGMAIGSDAVRVQENQGQTALVRSDVLPSDMGCHRQLFEHWGIVIHEPVEGDPMFVYVTLPDGWQKSPSRHPMWSCLRDERGGLRAHIFYRAAFYDRVAYIVPEGRYGIGLDDCNDRGGAMGIVTDHATGEVIHRTTYRKGMYEVRGEVFRAASARLCASGLLPEGKDGNLAAWDRVEEANRG